MIISHKHRFIFIKTKKTAGTSAEIALSRVCGRGDVITPVTTEDEALRQQEGGRGPQNYHVPLLDHPFPEIVRILARRRPRRELFWNHISAAEIRARVPSEVWSGYYRFCFERNPWDKTVSVYYWACKDAASPPGFREFVLSGEAARILSTGGAGLYTIDGEIQVDDIFRYEDLEAGIEQVTRRLGLPPLALPRAKSGYRQNLDYRTMYDDETRAVVARDHQREIDLLGYTF